MSSDRKKIIYKGKITNPLKQKDKEWFYGKEKMNDKKYLITFDNVYVSTTNIIVEAKNEDEAYEKYENGQYIKRTDTKPEHEETGEPHLEEYKESEDE